ncbi:MAG: hypothetical protein F6K47_14575 [Symploca sp. SIO2E6]|nr:hypothetical protein [Symploca sp. SIO2E6]
MGNWELGIGNWELGIMITVGVKHWRYYLTFFTIFLLRQCFTLSTPRKPTPNPSQEGIRGSLSEGN